MPQMWKVVGGVESGGILVREGAELKSLQCALRLSTGAEVEEIALVGDRLHYKRCSGSGPDEGWISVNIKGKELVLRIQKEPEELVSGTSLDSQERVAWMDVSSKKMQAFRDATPVRPDETVVPERLKSISFKDSLPPFKRLSPVQMAEMSVKNLPGHFSGLKFPHNSDQLKSFGPAWYTEAFHKFGTLPLDNKVVRIVSVEQLPHSGFDAAGGAGHKAFIEVEYAKPDPNLHTKLFAKFPWDYHESETGKTYRMQISTYADMDSLELLTNICCEHLLPFRIPKVYYADINRDTTNYVLMVERIPFGRRGKVANGRLVEKIQRRPFEILPVCGKYQDYLLEDAPSIYYALFREMAHLAAWDQLGHYDSYFGPKDSYSESDFLATFIKTRKPMPMKRVQIKRSGCEKVVGMGIDFALNVASQVFTAAGKDKKTLQKMQEELLEMVPYFDDISSYVSNSSDWVAAMHMNLQADNAYFWRDDKGDLDLGVFDWCGFTRTPFVRNFLGCLSGADADLLDAHEEGLMRMFCDEYERYGGPKIAYEEMLLRHRLIWPAAVMDACQWVERDIYRECPKDEWHTIKTIYDNKFVDRWNVRCRGTTLINAFEFYTRRDFKKIFDDWKLGADKEYLSQYE